MKNISREDILRMIGLRDSAGLYSKVNSLMIDMYDEGGKLAEYSTQIIQTSKNITLLAQRVTDDETDIADLTVTAQQISATVEHQQDEIDSVTGTVSSHTTQIGQLQTTAQQITANVSSLTTTVNGHTQSIGQLVIKDNEITQTVSSLSDDVDELDGTVTNHTSQISTLRTDLNGISATVSADHTTLGQHTTKIGQLEVTTGGISQRVTVIEGDYVKNAQILLMVTKNEQGYISNALIDADDIDFVFTDAVSWYWQSQTEANKRMGLDADGNLWISGQYRGGTITDNVTIGTGTNNMVIRPRGTNGAELVGLVNNSTAIRLWFQGGDTGALDLAGSHFSASYWDAGFVTYRTGSSGGAFAISMDGTGKIHIGSYANQGSMVVWPRSRNDVEIGQVFLGDDEILRVKTA